MRKTALDCAVHNIATREIIDLMKNNVKNTDFQGKHRVFVGIVSRLQFFTSCYIMNRTGLLKQLGTINLKLRVSTVHPDTGSAR